MSIEPGDETPWDPGHTPVYLCFDAEDLYAARLVTDYALTHADLDHYMGRENAPLEGDAADTIRTQLRAEIEACRVFVCLIGPLSAENRWVAWEIETAKTRPNRPGLVGAFLEERHERPARLSDAGAVFVPFNRDHLERAVRWAVISQNTRDDFEFRDMGW